METFFVFEMTRQTEVETELNELHDLIQGLSTSELREKSVWLALTDVYCSEEEASLEDSEMMSNHSYSYISS